ncbi:uncharacterized protein BBA_04512 [Beauveria bassiana ARSEF 2860]|uniref:Uncharacterized protein n=1 Tax=Beauveria bassiana (strain ARSEF 2860) TaxID=655819 RepID=J4UNE8_BEAB2|nr:uncharacterized protein BBA_04512 [Beauveria bassiana ARSEF 2860]EJP66572.1 hypothetical protein BBA_04512 [Beauveria bassiana ARSEF 2860]
MYIMHQNIVRLVGVAAAILAAANATASPVLCGAIDAVWQEQAAVVGNYPECASYYDSSNLDQTVDLDSEHPHMARFNACKRYSATTWACPTIDEQEGAESEQTEQGNHDSLTARRFRKRAVWTISDIERRAVINNSESEQADETNRDSTKAGRLCRRTFTNAHWGCPGAGKREEVQGTKVQNGNWPPHKREVLAASNVDAKVGSGLAVAAKPPGNWPPHIPEGLGLDMASKPPGNWPPHKREAPAASNTDVKVDTGINVAASKSPGNWPPHTREGLGLDVASKPPGNWPPHKRRDAADEE